MIRFIKHTTKGESILELLLAVAIFSIIIPTILYVIGTTADRQASRNWYYESLLMLEDVQDVIKQKKTTEWDLLAQNAMFKVERGATGWEFTQVTEALIPTQQDDLVAMVFSEEAKRDADGLIVENGGYADPATRKITIIIDWYGAVAQTKSSLYITRTDNLKSVNMATKDDFESGAIFDGTAVVTGIPGSLDAVSVGKGAPGPLSGVMSYWSMDGETESSKSEIDLAEGGTDNLFFEGTPQFENSLFGKSLLTGTDGDRLYASPSARLDLTGTGSFVLWLKNSTNPTTPQTIIDKHNANAGYIVKLLSGGQIEATVSGAAVSTSAKTQKTVLDGLWHMIGFSYNNDLLIPYFDGVQDGDAVAGQSSLYPSSGIISVGNDNEDAKTPFGGAIDDVQLYASALTPDDFQNLLYAKYESRVVDLGQSSLVHGFSAKVIKPEGAKVEVQMSVTNKVSGACEKPTKYIGPNGQEAAYYSVGQTGENSVSFSFPMGNFPAASYFNPGECVSFRLRFYWNKGVLESPQMPSVSNIKILYSL